MAGFDTSHSFGWASRLLHWATFVLVATLFAVGYYMVDLPNDPDKFEIYALHKSIGITVLALTVLRVLWRLFNPSPVLLGVNEQWQRLAARATHVLLYVLLLMMPLSGWTLSSAADFPVVWFGLFELPYIAEPGDDLRELATTVHVVLGFVLAGLLALHVAAALKHHFVDRDATLRRMVSGRGDAPSRGGNSA